MTKISRSAGKSAVAAAAYRTATRLRDPRTGDVHDFIRRRRGVLAVGRVGWDGDTQSLWAAVETSETRKNSTTAREIVVALPAELSAEDSAALTHAFARTLRSRHGVAVEWAMHAPGRGGDQRNRHAHIMATTRRSDGRRLGEKARELDARDTGPQHVAAWRQEWERLVNEALGRAGLSARVDSRSHKAKGDGLEPVPHLGPAVVAMERRGIKTTVGERHRKAIERNRQRLAELVTRKAAARLGRMVPSAVLMPPRPLPVLGKELRRIQRQVERTTLGERDRG